MANSGALSKVATVLAMSFWFMLVSKVMTKKVSASTHRMERARLI
jgi:hypothetical protein